MTWLDALRRSSLEDPRIPITSQAFVDMLVGPPAESGIAVNEKTALAMPAVYRAIALLAGTVAGLPLGTFEKADDVRKPVDSDLMDNPHPDLTRFEWMELAMVHNLSWGNTYFRKYTDQTGRVAELWPIEPYRVRVGRTRTGQKVYAVSTTDLGSGAGLASGPDLEDRLPLTDREILHVPGLGYDGTIGLSPIALARQGIGLALAAEKYGAKLFGSGNLLTGILTTDQKLSPDQAETIKSRWKAQHSGMDAAHDIGVLGQGTKFQSISVPPEDAQFIESRRFQIGEVARIYGVPPHMLMDTERSTSWGTGIEQQSIGFVVWTLRNWLTRFEQRLTKLLPDGQFAKFNVEGLLRGDSAQRASFYRSMFDMGALSTNEIRSLEERPPVEGGDVRYRPLNMGALGSTDTANPASNPAAEPPAPTPPATA